MDESIDRTFGCIEAGGGIEDEVTWVDSNGTGVSPRTLAAYLVGVLSSSLR